MPLSSRLRESSQAWMETGMRGCGILGSFEHVQRTSPMGEERKGVIGTCFCAMEQSRVGTRTLLGLEIPKEY